MSQTKKPKEIFSGVATALITPFQSNGIDYSSFGALVEEQIDRGVNALVVAGTTGEASTLEDSERFSLTEWAHELIRHRVPLIVGVGSNNTRRAVYFAKRAQEFGADALLCVTPYYNKGNKAGIIQHYFAVADATCLPLIVYNVPSRTGVNLLPEDYLALSEHPNIVAVKEADSDINKLADAISLVGDRLTFYSGNDAEILPSMSLGAKGVISVLSNICPASVTELCQFCLSGQFHKARALHEKLLPAMRLLFRDVNPAPIKCALANLGVCEELLRLPMAPVNDLLREKIKNFQFLP